MREEERRVQIVITKSGSNARDVGVAFTTVAGTAKSKTSEIIDVFCEKYSKKPMNKAMQFNMYLSPTDPVDYASRTQLIMFGSGDDTLTVMVPIVDDSLAESVETFSVRLFPIIESVRLSAGAGEATVKIADNDCKELYN